MDKFIIKDNKKGFTLVEIIVVLIIIAILAAIAIPAFTGYIDKTKIAVMEHNQSQVIRTIQLLGIEGALYELSPPWISTLRVDLIFKTELEKTGFFVANPINKSTTIKTSNEFGSSSVTSAGIIIAPRSSIKLESKAVASFYPGTDTSQVSKTKASGSICIQVVTKGAIVSYYYNDKHYNITGVPIDY